MRPRTEIPGRGLPVPPLGWLGAALALTILVYWPGLTGPFLFDDPPNIIQPIQAWLDGRANWQEVVFGNRSGLLHRPISNLSFLLNAQLSGLAVAPFKLTNLVIHLSCGALIYALLVSLLQRDDNLAANKYWAALAVTALWLLHPIQVSTILYVVQRMAQLSAFFMLAALLIFVHARLALLEGQTRRGILLLWLLVPAATGAATLSKENGALVPLLCAIVEIVYFRPSSGNRRPRSVQAWFMVFLIIPATLVISWYGWHWQRLADSYVGRSFTLGQRLLTEPRVIIDYLATLLWPRGPALGVYTDDFVASTSLFTPPSTLLAMAALLGLSLAAWRLRKKIPAFTAGMGLYLAALSMESTIFPLLLHFEHRNYLPSVGFFLALIGLLDWALPRVKALTDNPNRFQRIMIACMFALLAALGAATFARAQIWSSFALIATQGAQQHPQSRRAQLDYAHILEQAGEYERARNVFEHMLTMNSAQARHVGAIDLVTLDCMEKSKVRADDVKRLDELVGVRLQLGEMLAFENLANWLDKNDLNSCDGLNALALADLIVRIADAAQQPEHLQPVWRSRFNAARIYVAGGDLGAGEQQAALAWRSGGADTAVGVYLASIYLAVGKPDEAGLIVKDARRSMSSWDKRNAELLNQLDGKLSNLQK